MSTTTRRFVAFALALMLVPAHSSAQNSNRSRRSGSQSRSTRTQPAELTTPVFSQTGNYLYDKFLDLAASNKEATIDGFLQRLSEHTDFRSSIKAKSLAYASRSRHGSSFENPRALIMYGNSELVVTFNGQAGQKLYNSLEIMGYNNLKGEFEFREIEFKAEPSIPGENTAAPEFAGQHLIVKRTNSSCLDCHGYSGAMPVWDTYLAWPGVYGSFEEHFELPRSRYTRAQNQTELRQLERFIQEAPRKSRYRHFHWGYDLASSTFAINATYFGILLNYRVAHMALKQALKALKEPANEKYRFALAGYLLDCMDSNFITEPKGAVLADSPRALQRMMNDLFTDRIAQELKLRREIIDDHAKFGDSLTWIRQPNSGLPAGLRLNTQKVRQSDLDRQPYSWLAIGSAQTARPDYVFKLARMTNLFNAIKVPASFLYIQGSTSWDGYNEIPEYMSEYLFKAYGLPSVVTSNKVRAEKGTPRPDLDSPLLDRDFQDLSGDLEALRLPQMPPGGKPALCRGLAAEALR